MEIYSPLNNSLIHITNLSLDSVSKKKEGTFPPSTPPRKK